jgi:hypothetical protein
MTIDRIIVGAMPLANDKVIVEDSTLRYLVDEAWREYDLHRHEEFVVKPSIPVLFFGDLQRYFLSPIRVVTVGLNPSRIEFPCETRFQRFPEACGLDVVARDATFRLRYIATLSAYFRVAPYMKWFNAYEYILKGMNGSYCNGAANTALHTDICSSLATDPTWSRLSPVHKIALQSRGQMLWHHLITYLAPDVLFVSIAQHLLNSIPLTPTSAWRTIHTIPQTKRPYEVRARTFRVIEGKDSHLVFGQAANIPFGTVSYPNKQIIGERVKEYISG